MTEDDIKKFVMEWTKKIMIWGSDEVVSSWSNYRRSGLKIKKADDMTQLKQVESLLKSMRKDVGHTGKKLKEGEILGLFINDVETIYNKKSKKI